MASKHQSYGALVNSFAFSEGLDGAEPRNLRVYAALFSSVSNPAAVVEYAFGVNDYNRPSADSGAPDAARTPRSILDFGVLYLVLRPAMIVSLDHVLHSVARALTNVLNSKPISSNFTTEVAYTLSGSSNVGPPDAQVGRCIDSVMLSKSDRPGPALIVTLWQKQVGRGHAQGAGSIFDVVAGVPEDLRHLSRYSNRDEIAKVRARHAQEFKISEEELGLPGGLEASVLGRIGTKRI